MEAKRRKLDSGQADEVTKKSILVSEEFIEAIKSSNLDRVMSDLLKLKKHLTTKARVLELLEKDRPIFRAIISFAVNQGSAKFCQKANKSQSNENQQQINSVLREAFSLLANTCHLSVLACIEIRSKDLGLSPLYVRFLEANTTLVPISLKAALLRLLGNLCELKETALLIALNRQLVERIALCLELDDKKVVDQALRIIRYLAKRPQLTKSVIRSEACFHLAKYIVPRNENGEIFEINSEMLKIFHFLSKHHASSMGRQFANSTEFVEQCLSLLLKFPSIEEPSLYYKYWIGIIMGCIESSFEMRTVLGNSAISKVLELEANKNELCDLHCRFLCAFTQDVHKLTWLHESSGMSKILDKLKIIDDNGSNENEKLTQLRIQDCIFESFRFTTYSETIGFIVQYPTFMPTALFHIRKYLDLNATKCEIKYIEPEKIGQNEILILDDNLHTEQQQNEGTIDEQQQPLCKDFSSLRREIFFAFPSASPQSSNAWSPSMSPSTSGVFSTSNPSASPPGCSSSPHSPSPFILDELLFPSDNRQLTASPILNASAPNELEPDDPNELEESLMELKTNADDDAERNKEEQKLRRKIVENILKLISKFSHLDERKSIFLLKSEILEVLIRYISEAPEMHEQLARALRRLARHQTGLEILLAMDFNWMVITHLIRRPCVLARHSRRCARCDIRRDIGRSMLADHELLADSSMGEYVLLKVKMDAAVQMPDLEKAKYARLKILMAALMLFDDHIRRHNFYYNFRPIDALLGELSRILKEEELSEETEEGQICCDILATFGRIISKNYHRFDFDPYPYDRDGFDEDIIELSRGKKLSKNVEKCILEDESNSEEEKLKFKNKEGQLMVEVPKKELCKWNEYFSGMFNSEFIERVEGRDQFEFDSEMEGCSEQEFITFLHFSIGCPLKSECVRIPNAECCAALLYLADKYLCTRLLDNLLANKNADRFINGRTLRLFLPLVLSVPTIVDGGRLKNISTLVLLRNSSNSELISTLCHIQKCDSGNGRIIDALMTTIHDFIFAYAGP